jgi:hypothetical protein
MNDDSTIPETNRGKNSGPGIAFLQRLFERTKAPIELRGLPSTERIFSREWNKLGEFIDAHLAENVYFGVATRDGNGSGDKKSCVEVPALWTEGDFKSTPETELWKLIKKHEKQIPSLVIFSGGGLHLYWLLRTPAPATDPRIEPTLKGLAQLFKADGSSAELARILRLPGTRNRKYQPGNPEVAIRWAHWDRRYSLEDFADLVAAPPSQPRTRRRSAEKKIPEGERNDSLTSLAGTMRRPGMTPDEIEAALQVVNRNRCDPPLPEDEVRSIAQSVGSYQPEPPANDAGTKTPAGRPTITLRSGALPWIVDEAGAVLAERAEGQRVFQRGTTIVRIFSLPKESKTNWGRTTLKRQAGTLLLEALDPAALCDILGRIARWQRLDKKGNRYDVDCPPQVATTYRSRTGAWGLPVLGGIISAPLMLFDGTVLNRAGYDSETGLFLAEEWPEVNSHPTRDDALTALVEIVQTFGEFPFVTPADRSVFVAAILTALQRRLLASSPLFAFSAPAQRTGKSLLAESVAILATGVEAPAMAVSQNRDEIRKAVTAVLMEGHAIVNLDNIEHPLKSPDLARAITQPFYLDRVLGESRTTASMPTNLLWTATGNNLSFRGDLAVRALLCQLDAEMERPEERKFKIPDLKSHILEHRRELVVAALKILRAYVAAGKPDQNLKPWGGFDEWSDTVRATLVWLGLADPCQTRQCVIDDDPDREQAGALLAAWHNAFPDESVRILTVVQHAIEDQDLKAALSSVAGQKDGGLNSYKLSHWCREWNHKIVGGFRISKDKEYKGHNTWKVVRSEGR